MLKVMPKDFIKDEEHDNMILKRLYPIVDEVDGKLSHVLIDAINDGSLPALKDWYWDSYLDLPCYVKDGQVYVYSEEILGTFDYAGTLEEYQKKCEDRIRLGEYGQARMSYLEKDDYGTWFALLTKGELWEHCQEIEQQAEEREEQMMENRMKKYESMKDTDPMEYGQLWNQERKSVQEIIYAELIY